jgi:hypothetical protein
MVESHNYESIKALSRTTGRNIPELLCLAKWNDPFYCGAPSQWRDGEWFAAIWKRFGLGNGSHLRRIHYRLVSQKEPVLRWDGMPYQNTEQSWEYLQTASKCARYLGLVAASDFTDRRNPEPQIFARSRDEPVPAVWVPEPDWRLPSIDVNFEMRLALPQPEITGYDYSLADQRYHLAIWIEKSTMNDVLEPLCERFGVDLIVGIGFNSVTSVINFCRRAAGHGKPARLFYVSDFDPGGEAMPIATARQTEFWAAQYCPNIQIKLQPVALTKEQVNAYRLPRIPIKDSDKRKGNFEIRHGEGAVELDALEALHPGALARIVRKAIAPYFDHSLYDSLAEVESEANDHARDEWDGITEAEAAELKQIGVDAKKITESYKARATALQKDFDREIAPLKSRMEAVRQAIALKADDFDPELPERPEPAVTDADDSGWLFDSERPYMDQLAFYRRQKQ